MVSVDVSAEGTFLIGCSSTLFSLKGGVFSSALISVLVLFPDSVAEYPNKSNLMEKGFLFLTIPGYISQFGDVKTEGT